MRRLFFSVSASLCLGLGTGCATAPAPVSDARPLVSPPHSSVMSIDMTRLSQELADNCREGRPFFAEPGLIILEEVTRSRMEAAVRTLAAEGFFDAPG
ncbi:hypothetical protein F0U60_54240 [Archangium minus]|uniref:Lipoprotein n=1 Tax=Archangium minus TaxID=83450 RepID=A0ABY9X9L9_9BACT|nr:hypothetical protein F0U60_54240 [Archangium minus]